MSLATTLLLRLDTFPARTGQKDKFSQKTRTKKSNKRLNVYAADLPLQESIARLAGIVVFLKRSSVDVYHSCSLLLRGGAQRRIAMRSLNNQSVNVVVNDHQDRRYVAGTVELREGLLLSGMRLLGTARGLSMPIGTTTVKPGAPPAPMSIAAIPRAFARSEMRLWHPGHRYLVTCFACSA